MNRNTSASLFSRAQDFLVGGVNSPVRAFRGVGGEPVFIERAEGPAIYDADGNRYIDYVLTWGPAILGHAHPAVVKAVQEQATRGTSFGAPCALEIELAERIREAVPMAEKVRFVSSGTEATMSALRLARGITGRDGIVKCEGCYHGHADSLLVKAGSGVSTLGLPDSPGVPADLAKHTFNVPYNDADALERLLAQAHDRIACVILEPVAGNMGCVPPQDGYLARVAELCRAHDVLLIFDEVMTGFRVSLGGAQEHFGVTPDITCFGKVVGGGLPVGAVAGSGDVMAHLAPEGPIYQAGTLSGNPLAMAAGLATLKPLFEPGVYESLGRAATRLSSGLVERARAAGIAASAHAVGSMFSLFFADKAPTDFASVKATDAERFRRYFWAMLDEGIYLAPSAFESGFVSTAHTDAEIDATLDAAERVFAKIA